MADKERVDEILDKPQSVSSDAGSVSKYSVSDAIKLDKYKSAQEAEEEKRKKKGPLSRIGFFRFKRFEE